MIHKRIFLFLALIWICTEFPVAAQSVIINEIMYAPSSGKPEWVELLNTSTQTVNIKGWILSDATSSRPVITSVDFIIQPDSFVVISKDASLQNDFSGLEGKLIVMDKFPALNNTGDDVILRRPDSSQMDLVSFTSSWGGSGGYSLERIDPSGISNDAANWKSSTALRFATPGAKNSVAKVARDVALTGFGFSPPFPRFGTSVIIQIHLLNIGSKSADFVAVELYEDKDKNGMTDASEQVFTSSVAGEMFPGTKALVEGTLPASNEEERILIAILQFSGDENPSNNLYRDTIQLGLPKFSIVINEFMYMPMQGEPEWIELFNTTGDQIELSGWKIGDNSSLKEIPPAVFIEPHGFLVVSSSNSIFDYHALIPSPVIPLSIPSLNNTGDAVRIADKSGFIIDSVSYDPSWGGNNGRSLERINATFNSDLSTTWNSSEDLERSSPGRQNSISIRDVDLALGLISISGSDMRIVVRNVGLENTQASILQLFIDRNLDSVETPDELLATKTIDVLAAYDSTIVNFSDVIPTYGFVRLIILISSSEDQRLSNNRRVMDVFVTPDHPILAINEIMYAPLPKEAEWVEYFNSGQTGVNASFFTLAGQPGSDGKRVLFTLPSSSRTIPAGGILVISSDSSIFKRFSYLLNDNAERTVVVLNRSSLNLTNISGEVVLLDPNGSTIDSVRYEDVWNNPNIASTSGFSLERLNPVFPVASRTSWSTTTNQTGGTPGLQNSVFTSSPTHLGENSLSLSFEPNPFSPDGDGYEDFCVLSYSLPGILSQVRVRVFDSQGRLVRTISNNIPVGKIGQIIWDGLDENKGRLRVGIYIVLLEALNTNNSVMDSIKRAVVIATKL